jgi:hypothetical protein
VATLVAKAGTDEETQDMQIEWPSEYTRQTDVGWTARVPRPAEGNCHPSALADRQKEWDAAEETRQRIAEWTTAIRTKRDAAAAAKQERTAARQRVSSQRKEEALTDRLRRRYMATLGATSERFAAALPELLEQERRRLTTEGEEPARRAHSALYRTF